MSSNKTNNIFGFIKKHSLLAGFLIVLGAGVAFAMADGVKTYTWRYKMTIEVDTPEGVKVGSAVREVINEITPYPMDEQRPWRNRIRVKGEAVVVSLGGRGTFFALLDGDDAYGIVFKTFPYEGGAYP